MGIEGVRQRGSGWAGTSLKVIRNESDECRARARQQSSFTATATASDKATVLTSDNRQPTTDSRQLTIDSWQGSKLVCFVAKRYQSHVRTRFKARVEFKVRLANRLIYLVAAAWSWFTVNFIDLLRIINQRWAPILIFLFNLIFSTLDLNII